MANHTTPPFQLATGSPLEKHVLSPIEGGGPICGVLILPAVEWCTINTSLHITLLHHREVHTHGTNRPFLRRKQRRRAPRTEGIEPATIGAGNLRDHYATRHATKTMGSAATQREGYMKCFTRDGGGGGDGSGSGTSGASSANARAA